MVCIYMLWIKDFDPLYFKYTFQYNSLVILLLAQLTFLLQNSKPQEQNHV